MTPHAYDRLVMLGAAPEAHGSIASVVDVYRAQGLFKRWPIEYLVTHRGSSVMRDATLAAAALGKLIAVLARDRRAIVHLHTAPGLAFWRDAVFMVVALLARCPLVLHLHGAGFERFYGETNRVARAAIEFLFEHAEMIVVPCEFLRSWARSVARGARVECLPVPVPPVEAPPQSGRANLVLCLSRLDAPDGLLDLIEAMSAVRSTIPDARLVCAGDGDRRAAARYAERLGIAEAVIFTGWVGPSGKRALLESAAVFALPSYEQALPVSLLEAMNAGVPVVASPVGGVREVLVDGVSGFLVAPGDVATLQRLLTKLLLERSLGARIGAAGRESVRRRCAPERALARLEALYAALGLQAFRPASTPLRTAGMKEA